MPLQQFDERVPYVDYAYFNDTYTPDTIIDIEGGNAFDLRFDLIQAVSTSVADIDLTLYLGGSSSHTAIGGITIPAGAGYGILPAADLMMKLFGGVGGYLILPTNYHMWVSLATAPSAGKLVTVWVKGGSF